MAVIMICPKVFFLFTSNKSLYEAKRWFSKNKKIIKKRVLLSQGDSSREELLMKFREDGKGILLGTKSFWEGVDVRGAALKMVIIDKLPFKLISILFFSFEKPYNIKVHQQEFLGKMLLQEQ